MDASRSRLLTLLLAAATVAAAVPGADPVVDPTAAAGVVDAADVGPGYFSSGNATLDRNVPVNSGTAGARVVGEQLLVTDQAGLTVYDVGPRHPGPGRVRADPAAVLLHRGGRPLKRGDRAGGTVR